MDLSLTSVDLDRDRIRYDAFIAWMDVYLPRSAL
jgi:hypothetical protein